MTLMKTIGFVVILLVVHCSLGEQGYRQSFNVLFEGADTSPIHARQRRAAPASLNATVYQFKAVLRLADLQKLRLILANLTLPIPINNTGNIISINTTTVCSSVNSTNGYQCKCEESYAWSYNTCRIHEACDAIIGNTCGCINTLQVDGLYCQPNISQIEPVEIDVVIDLRVPVSSVPSSFLDIFRSTLPNVTYPHTISPFLKLLNLSFTTGCTPHSTGLQCQCEDQFAWPCDQCGTYGTCSNISSQTCDCINGLPGGQYCEPITSIAKCPTPTTPMTVNITTPNITSPTPNITTPTPNITTPMTTVNITTPTPNITSPNITSPTPNITSPNITSPTPNITTPTPLPEVITTPLTNTTTPMTTLNMTSPPEVITTQITTLNITTTNIITSTSMTPTITTTTTTPTPVTDISVSKDLSITLNMEFKQEYNDPNNDVYKIIKNAIEDQCKKQIPPPSLKSFSIKSGSVIADYTITASSIPTSIIDNVKTGLFTQLGKIYPVVFDSTTPLKFDPAEVFFEKSVTVTCGPPPDNLNFSTDWTAQWSRGGVNIIADSGHIFSKSDNIAKLEVTRFYFTDNGDYECQLIRRDDPKSVFRQKGDKSFNFIEPPKITVTPVKKFVKCGSGNFEVKCSVNSPYNVSFKGFPGEGREITKQVPIPATCTNQDIKFTCQSTTTPVYTEEITLSLGENIVCKDDPIYDKGPSGYKSVVPCPPGQVGEKTAVCKDNGKFDDEQDNCILKAVQDLLQQSEFLTATSLPIVLNKLSNITANNTIGDQVVGSPATISAIVTILTNVANASSFLDFTFGKKEMTDVLDISGVLTSDGAKRSWIILNIDDTKSDTTNGNNTSSGTKSNSPKSENITENSVSSSFLLSLEDITGRLNNARFDIETQFIFLNKTTFTNTFNGDFNSSVEIDIPAAAGGQKSITVVTFSSMNNVLPARDQVNSSNNAINGRVVLIKSNGTIDNISLTFDVLNVSLKNPKCVFWNFTLFDGLGGWDDKGCQLEEFNETVTCRCDHLTSFSILMSPYAPKDPVLDYITYIGVGISMASLVICLIIEAIVWRKIRKSTVAYLRHVSIVNIAVSLLIANIWFIIGAAISDAKEKNPPACSAATFFIHFFYLALFFWMLASALLLLYRTINVFDGGLSKAAMLAIGFCLGYGAPIIIATITIAVTAPKEQYIRGTGVCWLNWDESKALLALVIPALSIVVINLIILCVVMYKILKSKATSRASQAGEKHVLLVIARSLAVLTPFFGLTWGLGVGTMTSPDNMGIHISFAFFNSLQGFFILVFGTLLDKQVRTGIAEISQISSGRTRSTSGGVSSSGVLGFFNIRRRGRDGYNISAATSGESRSINT
ncbi:adhesion G protein-coupled receptor F5-like isoform X2 [Parambassis ranga]|uniref:Adhesion G protein-coupled receptor F5-like isoform X2 n=1 Tax=Parambassis ranga TaxID=210632 RepID=A0A6P7HTX6_9TELE|nr:adhesion G protein-coupled receptor F5-like isoform X2 [Parambassis ranga]